LMVAAIAAVIITAVKLIGTRANTKFQATADELK
jgi:Flp pilus assembly pilin Flp